MYVHRNRILYGGKFLNRKYHSLRATEESFMVIHQLEIARIFHTVHLFTTVVFSPVYIAGIYLEGGESEDFPTLTGCVPPQPP